MLIKKNKMQIAIACALFALSHPICHADQSTGGAEPNRSTAAQLQDSLELSKTAMFTPPDGWRLADSTALPKSVKIMVVGKGDYDFPPSLNLGSEVYSGTLKDYLATVKSINESQGGKWKNLGTIRTQAGDANLSQVDARTEWGEVRMMHVILLNDSNVYILTAAAVKDEFPKFYKDFFNSMRSLRFNQDVIDTIANAEQRKKLQASINDLKKNWQNMLNATSGKEAATLNSEEIFNSTQFQNNYWVPFKNALKTEYAPYGQAFESLLLQQVRNDLLN